MAINERRGHSRAPLPSCASYAGEMTAAGNAENARSPLWRGAQVFRLLALLYSVGFQLAVHADLTRPTLAWAFLAATMLWTGIATVAYLVGFGRNWTFVGLEVAVVVGLLLSTQLITDDAWRAANQPVVTTLWSVNAVISVAILAGPVTGVIAALVIRLTVFLAKGEWEQNLGKDASVVVLVAVGLGVGLAASASTRTSERLRAAARSAAAAEERAALARQVHDGALQTLALISRRGRELGGPSVELAELAATGESALRDWIARDGRPAFDGTGQVDLCAAVRAVSKDATVSAPPDPVPVPAPFAAELVGAVANAVENSRRHAVGAAIFVLVENLGDSVVLTVRDDGPGIPAGRLDRARRDGRLGVAESISGRVESLGGTAVLSTGPGEGTTWELAVPIPSRYAHEPSTPNRALR